MKHLHKILLILLLSVGCAGGKNIQIVSVNHEKTFLKSLVDRVVLITNFAETGWGSGVILHRKGNETVIATAAHVVDNNVLNYVKYRDKLYRYTVVRIDTVADFALINVKDFPAPETILRWSKHWYLGQKIITIGYPSLSADEMTISITRGVVATKVKKSGKVFLRITSAIYFGNSGGPVFDEEGNLICVVSHGTLALPGVPLEGHYYCALP